MQKTGQQRVKDYAIGDGSVMLVLGDFGSRSAMGAERVAAVIIKGNKGEGDSAHDGKAASDGHD